MTLDRRRFLTLATLATVGVAAGGLTGCGSGGDADTEAGAAAPAGDPATSTAPTPPTTAVPAGTWTVSGRGDRPEVALTFHTDGPTSIVEAVLDAVEARGLVITAFVVGSWLDANPAMGERLVGGGHELANHTYTHPGFESLTPDQMADEVGRCRAALERHAGTPGQWFRPSGTDNGIDSPSAAALDAAGAAGYPVIGYDVDPLDYRDPGRAAVVDRTLAGVVAGSIVSLHMGHQGTVDAVPGILDGLDQQGLRPVAVSELLR